MESTLVNKVVKSVVEAKPVIEVSPSRRDAFIGAANIPLRHARCDIHKTEAWFNASNKVNQRLRSGALIMLCGNRGAGKTQIAAEAIKFTASEGRSSLYCTAMDFFIDVKRSYRSDAKRSEYDVINDYRKPSLLVIDEIGKRSDSDWENSLLFHLIDKRYCGMKDTILISNQERAGAVEGIGASLASRMQETGGIIECNWKSFREVTR